jgi:phospholipid/cholesterol/gamma-HCH transport system substrate-binding protein
MRKMIIGVLLAALAVSGCSVQTLGAPKGGVEFYADFSDVQNLVKGHSVQVSAVTIGSVMDITVKPDFTAKVRMSLKPGQKLPEGVTATIAKESLLGENYVRLTLPPGSNLNTGPFMRDGETVRSTTIQPDLESITEKVGPILASLGSSSLGDIVQAVSQAIEGKGPELNNLIKKTSDVAKAYAAAGDDLGTVIDGLGRLGTSLARNSDALDRLPGRLILATDRINADKKELKSAVEQLVRLGKAFNAKVQVRHGARLRNLLIRLDRILAKMTSGKETLKVLAKSLHDGFLAAPSLTYEGQGLMQAWLGGVLGFETDSSHIQNDESVRIDKKFDQYDRILSPTGQSSKGGS